MWLLIILALIVVGVGAYALRVPLMAKLTGQSRERIRRHMERKKLR